MEGGSAFSFDSALVFRLTVLLLWVVDAVLVLRMRRASLVGEVTDGRSSVVAA